MGDAGALGFGVNVSVEVPGGMLVWDVDSPRWPGLTSVSWTEAAVDAASPSESSELKALGAASEVIGSGPGVISSLTIDTGVVAGVDSFCLFLGCGSTVEETLCFERTGTGIVFRGFPRPGSGTDGLPGGGSGSDM